MTSCQATVKNGYGIHCRPSAVIAKEARSYDGNIQICDEHGNCATAANALELIGLGIHCGQTVTIQVSGTDETVMCKRMTELFETEFDFER